mgnify:FL=1
MLYTLCHKDIRVFNFEVNNGEIQSVKEIFAEDHIPVGLFTSEDKVKDLKSWWKSRSIPENRQGLKEVFNLFPCDTTEQLAFLSYGLSLSDCYWVKSENSTLQWSQVNFFKNDFSDEIGKALFGSLSSLTSLLSPDNTSDGWLRKKWIIDNGERILVKGGSGESQQEPFNEVLASHIAKRLGTDFVDYSVAENSWNYYSLCKTFASENAEFVNAGKICGLKKYSLGLWDKYTHFKDACTIAGIEFDKSTTEKGSIERNLCAMILLDYIIANTDRHFGNFGFLRNPDTLEWISLCPIFDTGSSLFYKESTAQLSDKSVIDSKNILARPFGYKHADQIKLLPIKEYFDSSDIKKLFGIEDFFESLLLKNKRIDALRRTLLCKILRERIDEVFKKF